MRIETKVLALLVVVLILFNIVALIPYVPNSPIPTGNTILEDVRPEESIIEETPQEEPEVETIAEEIVEEEIEEEEPEEEDEEEEPTPEPELEPEPELQYVKIANFNAQIFGDSKWEEFGEDFYVPLVEDYDIFFLQEIRDIDGSSFDSLCEALDGYQCDISSRAGRTQVKEQYGIIYKEGITATLTDYNPDEEDRWERPPVEVEFDINGYELTVWNIHIKPSDVEVEINYLEDVVEYTGNVIVLGDLNLDCTYDDGMAGDFEDWNYLIEDNDDTTVSQTDCAYDRIILNDDAYEEYENHGIDTSITEDESDHYLVWVELEI